MLCPSFTGRRPKNMAHNTLSEDRQSFCFCTQTASKPRMWPGRRPVKEDIHTSWKRCRNRDRKKVPLWACTKSGLFSGDRTAKPKTATRFWFCISDTRLISERGRRRTDYLRGIRLSSGLHLFRHCIRMQPFMFRRRLPERAGLSRTRDYNR